MRVLLDEQLPRHLGRELMGHSIRTVQQEGWAGLKNGELLQRAALEDLRPLVPAALDAISKVRTGEVIRVVA